MADFLWGLSMMAVGMGVVFGLLALLMALVLALGRLDARRPEPSAQPGAVASASEAADAAGAVRLVAGELDADQLAAVTLAVLTHARVRRRSAAPEARAYAPGSQLFASRWVASGRIHQTAPDRRR